MRLFAPVRFLSSDKNSFTSKEGEYVEYSENILKGKEGGTITCNSKANFADCEGKVGVAEIDANENSDGKGFKLTLKKFVEGATINGVEGELEEDID